MAKGQPKVSNKSERDLPEVPDNLPAVTRGRNLTEEQKIVIAECVCNLYQTDRYSLETCLSAVGIKSDGTWYKWCDEIEEIEALYQEATKKKDRIYRGRLKERGRTSLERGIEGYTITLTEQVYQWQEIAQEQGPPKLEQVLVAEKKKQVYVKPSPTLIQYVLNNLDSANFERSPEKIPVESDRVDMPRFTWVDNEEKDAETQ